MAVHPNQYYQKAYGASAVSTFKCQLQHVCAVVLGTNSQCRPYIKGGKRPPRESGTMLPIEMQFGVLRNVGILINSPSFVALSPLGGAQRGGGAKIPVGSLRGHQMANDFVKKNRKLLENGAR